MDTNTTAFRKEKSPDTWPVLARWQKHVFDLSQSVPNNTQVEWVSGSDPAGYAALQRTAIFILLKAFYDVVKAENIQDIFVEFTLGPAFFVHPEGSFTLDDALLEAVEDRMRQLASQQIPFQKLSLPTQQAREYFSQNHMKAKARLFAYRRTSRVNVYALEDFYDYFYGPMAPGTQYLLPFALVPFDHGFFLNLPEREDLCHLSPLHPAKKQKVFDLLSDSVHWSRALQASDAGSLNDQIAKGQIRHLIAVQEALQEKRIAAIAQEIARNPNRRFVLIAGPSSSGKTTFSRRLATQLQASGCSPIAIEVDDYFKNREDTPRHPDGSYDFESPYCVDIDRLNQDLKNLLEGQEVELPKFDFVNGRSLPSGKRIKLEDNTVLILEGIHCLNPILTASLDNAYKYRIYISAMHQLNIDEHNALSPQDVRLLRRLVRDARVRGMSAATTLSLWNKVTAGEKIHIHPYQKEADVLFNSAHVYELGVLKQYAEPLLFQISPDSELHETAARLLKYLDYFLSIPSEYVPGTSILREFIGSGFYTS